MTRVAMRQGDGMDRDGSLTGTRTWMYVPADQRRKLDKALTSAADAIIADLEDAVAADGKGQARATLAGWLDDLDQAGQRPHLWVRVNAESTDEDVAVAIHPCVEGICLPKVEASDQVVAIDALLGRLEPAGDPRPLMLMVETAQAVLRCADFATASHRVAVLQLGEQDLRADLGLPPDLSKGADPLPGPMQAARDAIVLASAAGGLAPPVGPVSVNIHDAELLAAETSRLRQAGFGSRALIHPAQIEPITRGFTPSEPEREWARRVIDAADRAQAEGTGVTVVDGGMVDAPVVATARRFLSR
ncbi:MAG TPA: CoA ester lyase [Mycobacteriales bacterium]|nr:CoA ester lyase [Mycobacteriales bacterium]